MSFGLDDDETQMQVEYHCRAPLSQSYVSDLLSSPQGVQQPPTPVSLRDAGFAAPVAVLGWASRSCACAAFEDFD